MKNFELALALLLVLPGIARAADDLSVSVADRPTPGSTNPWYVSHRAPLAPSVLIKLPVGAIRPRGWLAKELRLQADGFHGHLEEISGFLRKEKNAWLEPSGEGTHGWEEPVYWLKGYSNLAWLLGDEAMMKEAEFWLEAALRSQKADGWFGPDKGRGGAATRLKGRSDLWPNMIMLFALEGWYEFRPEPRVLDLMTRYFAYLRTVPEEQFLVGYWPKMRGGDLLYSVLWLYDRTGEKELLELARKVHRHTADWTKDVINWHNVNMSQGFGEPTTFWLLSGEPAHLEASYRNWGKIRALYGQVPGGMFGGDENCRPGFTGPRQAVETCGMVEAMLSDETLLSITGDITWADRCEDVAFNSLPAALTADLKALRYLTAPNMVVSDRRSKSPGLQNGGPMLWLNPHAHRCCQHNWGHGWPYYAEHLWFATPDRGVAALLYSDSVVEARVGEGDRVKIEMSTHYPFDDSIELTVRAPRPSRFPIWLRVPGWCQRPRLEIAGREVKVEAKPRQYLRVERAWRDGDRLRLTLPMEVTLRRWEKNQGSVSVDRGPLTYSLQIGEKKVRAGGTDEWPAWEVFPTTPWNYALVLDGDNPAASFELEERPWPRSDMPFTHEGTPLVLRAKGRRVPEWQLDSRGLVGKLQPSPVKATEPVEPIRLIPMGAARLRISAFPVAGTGPEAHAWKSPPKPAYQARASHCSSGDSERAMADGIAPKSSGDHSIPRFTWWDHRGTKEWVEARFAKARKVSEVEVYWFDDTGRGGCRVPESWRLRWRKPDGAWADVRGASEYGVALDRFNQTRIEPVETTALRIEVQLRPEFSGGILEWRVK